MTTLEEGVVAYLKQFSGLTALISTRVYPERIPDAATFPLVTYQRISTPRTLTMDTSGATGDLISPRFQFDAWATTTSGAKAITDQIRAALNGKTGSIGSVTIRASLADEEVPTFVPEIQKHRNRSEYIVFYEEA